MTKAPRPPGTWVLLRGLTREQRHWGEFPTTLAAHLPGARIITLDTPGNGELCHQNSPLTVPEMAAHCRAELARRGLAPPYNLLAMSLGAMVTTAWAHAHPDDIATCVLVNTSMRPFSAFHQRLRPRHYPLILKLALAGGTPREWEQNILRITTHHPPDPQQRLHDWVAFREDHPVSRQNALRQLWAAARYTAPRHPPAARTLILNSAQDDLVNPRCSRQIAEHWNADFIEHPTAGHDLPLDDGPWVARRIQQWLALTSARGH